MASERCQRRQCDFGPCSVWQMVHRQASERFADALNAIRDGSFGNRDLDYLKRNCTR